MLRSAELRLLAVFVEPGQASVAHSGETRQQVEPEVVLVEMAARHDVLQIDVVSSYCGVPSTLLPIWKLHWYQYPEPPATVLLSESCAQAGSLTVGEIAVGPLVLQ